MHYPSCTSQNICMRRFWIFGQSKSFLLIKKHLYLYWFSYRIYSGELPDEEFKDGLTRIKRLLLKDIQTEELPLSVIMHYAWWLTHESPTDGVEVFTRSPRTEDMDPDEILEKLEGYSNEGVRTYLEYLVMTQRSERAEYHTRLACSYVRDVQKEIENNNQLEQMQELGKILDLFKISIFILIY